MLEAIVGDIPALNEKGEPAATKHEDGSWLLDGMMSVDELQRLLDPDQFPEDSDDYETSWDSSWHSWDASPPYATGLCGMTCALRWWIWLDIEGQGAGDAAEAADVLEIFADSVESNVFRSMPRLGKQD